MKKELRPREDSGHIRMICDSPKGWRLFVFVLTSAFVAAQTTSFYQVRRDLGVPLSNYAQQVLARMDFDGDGREDVLLGGDNYSSTVRTPIYLLLNLGDGRFREATGEYIVGSLTALKPIAAVADLNGDGVPDVAIYDAGNMEVGQAPTGGFYGAEPQLLLSRPGRKWIISDALATASQAVSFYNTRNVHLKEVHAGDFDGDGKIDLFVESGGGYQNLDSHFVLNQGNESFKVDVLGGRMDYFMLKGPNGGWRYGAYAVADMDGDGALDLVMGTWRNENRGQDDARSRVAYNDGTGRFSVLNTTTLPNCGWNRDFTYAYRAAAIDFDGDGRLDIVFIYVRARSANGNDSEVTTGVHFQFLRNLGGRQFTDVTSEMISDQSAWEVVVDAAYGNPNFGWPQKIDYLDMNGDGRKDLVLVGSATNLGGVSPRIYLRTAGGMFEPINPNILTAGQMYLGQYMFPLPLNGDARPDLVMMDLLPGPDGQYSTGDERHTVVPILNLANASLPNITASSSLMSVGAGSTLTLTASVNGTSPITYQWYFQGSPIVGATQASLSIPGASLAQQGAYRLRVNDGVAGVTSDVIQVIVTGVPPAIHAQPVGASIGETGTIQLMVEANGSLPLNYEWRRNGVAIAGATSAVYSKPNASINDAGSYSVLVSNANGTITSASAAISVVPVTVAPAITTGPASGTQAVGDSIALTVTATGDALAYQWFKDGQAIAGATRASLGMSSATPANSGRYTVRVSNPAGTITSQPALVHIPPVGGINITAYASTVSTAKTGLGGYGQIILGEMDFNQDGLMDLLIGGEHTASAAKSPVSILLNLGSAGFRVATAEFFEGAAPTAHLPVAAIADLNGDGVPDFAIYDAGNLENGQQPGGGYLGEEPMLYLSKPGRKWAPSSALRNAALAASSFGSARVYLREVIAGDIDGDGDVDLWVESSGGYQNLPSHFVINQGNGTFLVDGSDARIAQSLLKGPTSNWRYGSYALADFDGDGKLDLVGGVQRRVNGGQDEARSRIWWNDGTGRFPATGSSALPLVGWNNGFSDTRKLLATDLNGDGRPDIVICHTRSFNSSEPSANQTGRYLQVLLNLGNRSFEDATARYFFDQSAAAAKTAPPYGNNYNYPQLILHRDLNGDGLADLFFAGVDTPMCREAPALYLRAPSGGFEPIDHSVFAGTSIYFGEVAYPLDLNADGKIDFISLDLQPGADGTYGTGDEYHATMPTIVGVLPMLPQFRRNPTGQVGASGDTITLVADAAGVGALAFQWYCNGNAIAGAVQPTYRINALSATDVGGYFVRVTDAASGVNSQPALVLIASAGHTSVGGYIPGGPVTISNAVTFVAGPTALRWQSLVPSGWSYVSDTAQGVAERPMAGQKDLLEWAWMSPPASPLTFNYVIKSSPAVGGTQSVVALATFFQVAATAQTTAKPDPIDMSPTVAHSADTDRDGRLNLAELLRVIELYNHRAGTVRTGQYTLQDGTEDGFTAGASGAAL
ncbi:MAG: VCBS repeat-containing protein, partial [Verrucomicrobia bacterium]|nr:VCBS repeat-containing protein [Verrucomicrobiota bacterium]